MASNRHEPAKWILGQIQSLRAGLPSLLLAGFLRLASSFSIPGTGFYKSAPSRRIAFSGYLSASRRQELSFKLKTVLAPPRERRASSTGRNLSVRHSVRRMGRRCDRLASVLGFFRFATRHQTKGDAKTIAVLQRYWRYRGGASTGDESGEGLLRPQGLIPLELLNL
jgi:hypothetical protein